MSWRATAYVNELSSVTRSEKLLLFVLSDRYNEDKRCAYPSIAGLAKDALMSEATVHRSIKKLKEKGIIEVEEQLGRESLYRFPNLPPPPSKMTPVPISTGVKNRLPEKYRGVTAMTGEGCHSCDTRTVIEPQSKEEPIRTSPSPEEKEGRPEDQELNPEMLVLRWMEKKAEGAHLKLKVKKELTAWPRQQEKSIGLEIYRRAWLAYIEEAVSAGDRAVSLGSFCFQMKDQAGSAPSNGNGHHKADKRQALIDQLTDEMWDRKEREKEAKKLATQRSV